MLRSLDDRKSLLLIPDAGALNSFRRHVTFLATEIGELIVFVIVPLPLLHAAGEDVEGHAGLILEGVIEIAPGECVCAVEGVVEVLVDEVVSVASVANGKDVVICFWGE